MGFISVYDRSVERCGGLHHSALCAARGLV
jgi:hypothetical protein